MHYYELIGAVLDAQIIEAHGVVTKAELAVCWEAGHRNNLIYKALIPQYFSTCGPDADVA